MFSDLENTYSAIFGENASAIWRDRSAITLEVWRNLFGEIRWRFGETWSAIWRNLFGKNVGDLEKRGQRFGETCSAKTLEIWRNVVGVVMAILYWSSLWCS